MSNIAINSHPNQPRGFCGKAQPGEEWAGRSVVLGAGGEAGLGTGMAEGHLWGRNAISWP